MNYYANYLVLDALNYDAVDKQMPLFTPTNENYHLWKCQSMNSVNESIEFLIIVNIVK